MTRATKFTFDTRFDEDFDPDAVMPKHVYMAELERARAEAYTSGFTAGSQEANTRVTQEFGATLQNFAASAASLLAALDVERASLRRDAISLSLTVARKLAPAMVASRPETEIEATLRDCLTHLNREPHIVLRVAESMVGKLRDIVDRMALERGMTGRIILLAQAELAEGDCIVEWADGGLEHSRAAIEQQIDEAVQRYVETLDYNSHSYDSPARHGSRETFF